MALIKQHKIVGSLPSILQADSIYFVRVGSGFDFYLTNGSGVISAYSLNLRLGGFDLPTDSSRIWAFRPAHGWVPIGEASNPLEAPINLRAIWLEDL